MLGIGLLFFFGGVLIYVCLWQFNSSPAMSQFMVTFFPFDVADAFDSVDHNHLRQYTTKMLLLLY